MTRQPAVHVGIFYAVAADAEFHVKCFSLYAVKRLHFAMAFRARNLFLNVPLVIEQNMFGQIIGFFPGRRRSRVEIPVFFLYPEMIGNNVFVAMQAFFNRRKTRMPGITHIRVAILALNVFDPGMDPMTEGNRLLRPDIGSGRIVEEKQKARHEHGAEKRHQGRPSVSNQGGYHLIHQCASDGCGFNTSGN